ncbi:MAG: M4 family metallopeptidase [Chloroflexi bacterium]|nr:M4 family metallopeptidase [Chloroflexota bacterium]
MNHQVNCLHCIIPPHMLDSILANGNAAQRKLALDCIGISGGIRGHRQALMSAVAYLTPLTAPGKHRTVYTANNGSSLPGQQMRDEGQPPSSDVAVNEAYDGAGLTYDLYWDVYQRNSLDGNGLHLDSTVHYQQNYDNAFWNGQQMVYGDGDGQLFNRFTIAVDVIGHELTHGVTQYMSNLDYQSQSGALNESFSDVFGTLVKQRKLNQTADQADWLIGEGLLTASVHGVALRSMKAPGTAYDDPVLGKDPQPADMAHYVNTTQDNGGVHINSGIPNRAFYLTAAGIGGYAWEKAGKIWYVAGRDKFKNTTDFQGAADLTTQTAGELFGTDSAEQQAVKNAWITVGITPGAPQTQPQPQPSGCVTAPAAIIRSIFGGS